MCARSRGRRRDPLGCLAEIVNGVRRISGRVLDGSTHEPGGCGLPDRLRYNFRCIAETLLEIGRDRQVGRARDDTCVRERLAPLTAPSSRPSVAADAPLEVASAAKPSPASTRAEPPSHALAITNTAGAWWSSRKRRAFSD